MADGRFDPCELEFHARQQDVNPVLETLRSLGPIRLSALAGVTVGLIAFFIYLTTRLSSPGMALLYGELEIGDSSRIVSQLEALSVPYALHGDGRQIMVPADQVLRLRMVMAEEGLPSGGSVGYEIFDDSSTLGSTNFVQSVNRGRALEGELARTIRSLGSVASARVHLVLPQRQLFSRQQQEPSASIVLKIRGAGRLASGQVASIQHLVAAAVPRLTPARVSIVDDKGNLLARGNDAGDAMMDGGMTTDEMRTNYESRLGGKVKEMLERVIGYGKVRVNLTAEMDFDRIITKSETFDPDSQVARSINSVEATEQESQSDGEEPVSVEGNLPNAAGIGAGGASNSQRANTSEVVNYEISKQVVNHVRQPGAVKRVSVAVLVDGEYEPGTSGAPPVYKPRTSEEMEQLGKLVRSAIGFDSERGDTVEIVNMPFATPETAIEDGSSMPFGLEKQDLIRLAEVLVLAIVGILVVLLVVRPLIDRTFTAPQARKPETGAAPSRPLLTDQSRENPVLAAAMAEAEGPNEIDQLIDLGRVEGRVRASSLKKLGDIVEKHPEEAVAILRNWMHQSS